MRHELQRIRVFGQYAVDTWGEEQAELYVRMINENFRQIADDPSLGRSSDAIREGYRKRSVGWHVKGKGK